MWGSPKLEEIESLAAMEGTKPTTLAVIEAIEIRSREIAKRSRDLDVAELADFVLLLAHLARSFLKGLDAP